MTDNQNAAAQAAAKDTLHLISHTHWDREWYFSFQHYRYRLVHLINQLLDRLPSQPSFKHFHLDGQSAVVEDYLEMEPAKRELLLEHIREGRILIGPWYVLADEFLVSGESLIRNLQLGDRQCREYGGRMNLGYLPDLFGHIGQMPQLLNGFGMREAIIWRGIGDRGGQKLPSEWIWQGTDGSEVLAFHLPDAYGYSNGSELPYEPEQLAAELRRLREETKAYAVTEHLLVMNGTDHQLAHFPIPGHLDRLNETVDGFEAIHSTLPGYVLAVKDSLVRSGRLASLPIHRGELRATNHGERGRFNFILPNVLSSRMYLKQWNEQVQTALERWAEPLASLASACGADYPEAQLRTAWKYLLQNHPHDSICGCSVDEVHRQMVTRFEWAAEIAEQAIAESMYAVSRKIGTRAGERGDAAFHVFNMLPFPATGTVETEIRFPAEVRVRDIELFDEKGNEIPFKLLGLETKYVMPDFMDHWPPSSTYRTNAARVCFLAENVPPMGYGTYYARPIARPNRQWTRFSSFRVVPCMENEFLRIDFRENGSFDLLCKETGKCYPGLNLFEDGADIGDGYTYSEPISDGVFTTFGERASFRLLEHSAVRTVYESAIDWMLPARIEEGAQRRSEELATCRLVSRFTLAAGSRRVDIETRFDNRAKDHRLRVLFATGLDADESVAAGSFAVDHRQVTVTQPDKRVWIEDEPVTFPHKGFIDVSDGHNGLAVIAPGLPEYEISDTEERAIALTLLRGVGYLGAGQRPLTIMSGAGPEMETPEAQCPGTHTFRYSVYAHAGDWEDGDVYEQTQLVSAGLRMFQLVVPPEQEQAANPGFALPSAYSFLQCDSPVVQFSALKKAEERGSLILRLFNPAVRHETAELYSALRWKDAYLVNLKEERQAPVTIEERDGFSRLKLDFKPNEIVTVELVLG